MTTDNHACLTNIPQLRPAAPFSYDASDVQASLPGDLSQQLSTLRVIAAETMVRTPTAQPSIAPRICSSIRMAADE